MTIEEFRQKQSLPYELKIAHAEVKAIEFYNHVAGMGADCHVSVGGLDSITLLCFLRHIGLKDVPAISVSTLEDLSNQEVHRQLGVIRIKPYKSQTQVLHELGFPVISKAKANKIEYLLTPNADKQTFIHAIMTGDMGAQGGFKHSDRIKLQDKWIKLFGGNYADMRPDLCIMPPPDFKVSAKCCYYMKEKPCDDWAKEHNSFPYLGLMASEGGQREMALMQNGCNYYGKETIRSAPFAIFSRQDLLQLAIDLKVPVPRAYGTIERAENGQLYTTRAQRTGCSMCGFGIHMEKRPHRFDRLRQDNPKLWDYWMNRCCKDENGTLYGWGRVLDWIGVKWRDEIPIDKYEQLALFGTAPENHADIKTPVTYATTQQAVYHSTE